MLFFLKIIKHVYKLIENLSRAKFKIPVREQFLEKYQISLPRNQNNIVFYDFKKI
jgi:hypothetical protein|tara:strand:- start:125 stop:289 length:165 start_codon:yes stop_codon:yes gene_type:complete